VASLVLSLRGAFAEFERSFNRERQREASPWQSSAAPPRGGKDPHTGTGRRASPARRQLETLMPKLPGLLDGAVNPGKDFDALPASMRCPTDTARWTPGKR
jgi:hypothetical protein